MPFLSRRDIASKVRDQADKAYKAQLRAALSSPLLTPEQRKDIRSRLQQVGQPKVYSADSPPPPGAIDLAATDSPPRYSADELAGLKKADLMLLAEEAGLATSGTKAQIIERLKAD